MNKKLELNSYADLKVLFEREAIKKMRTFVDLCSGEISGFGITYWERDKVLVKDVFLISQKLLLHY